MNQDFTVQLPSAGEFIDSDGNVRIAGQESETTNDGFRI